MCLLLGAFLAGGELGAAEATGLMRSVSSPGLSQASSWKRELEGAPASPCMAGKARAAGSSNTASCRQSKGGTLNPGIGTLLWRRAPCPRVLPVPAAALGSVLHAAQPAGTEGT